MAANRDSVTDRFPLLSGVDMDKGGLQPGTAGLFTDQTHPINDIHTLLSNMSGRTDNRASIPASLLAQRDALALTLNGGDDASKPAISQWRGAIATALLYPLLGRRRRLFVLKAVKSCRKATYSSSWFSKISQAGMAAPIQILALCVEKDEKSYPLLFCDQKCIVVPCAYGIEKDVFQLPWLEAAPNETLQFFSDPIDFLSPGELAAQKRSGTSQN